MKNREFALFGNPTLRDGRLSFRVATPDDADIITVDVPEDFHFHNDLAAAFLISIWGGYFKKVYFDFPVSDFCIKTLTKLSGSSLVCNGQCEQRVAGKQPYLAFSGGFDSLSAFLLADDYFKLASIDFGGGFIREKSFFTNYKTTTIATDFRTKRYDKHHWMFMGAPIILYADYLDISGIGFGTIFEATHYHLLPSIRRHPPLNDFRRAVSISDPSIVRGLTEFGTTKVVMQLTPSVVDGVLQSVADEGTEKQFRKRVLVKLVSGASVEKISDTPLPKHKVKLGESFAMDFLYYAFAASAARDGVTKVVSNPEKLMDFAESGIGMDWVNKYNPIFMDNVPYDRTGGFINKMKSSGIDIFDNGDTENYEKFRRYWLAENPGMAV